MVFTPCTDWPLTLTQTHAGREPAVEAGPRQV
eukprot:SAG25_NODE_12291_length_283_cov_0.820652_1_plen_31_part_01